MQARDDEARLATAREKWGSTKARLTARLTFLERQWNDEAACGGAGGEIGRLKSLVVLKRKEARYSQLQMASAQQQRDDAGRALAGRRPRNVPPGAAWASSDQPHVSTRLSDDGMIDGAGTLADESVARQLEELRAAQAQHELRLASMRHEAEMQRVRNEHEMKMQRMQLQLGGGSGSGGGSSVGGIALERLAQRLHAMEARVGARESQLGVLQQQIGRAAMAEAELRRPVVQGIGWW
eukprot:SAG11_NODE_3786_length_2226_cov_2.160790_1_plen_238_part_00